MGLSLTIARVYIPQSLKRRRLLELFAATAEAFRTPMPVVQDLPFSACLRDYALFTRDRAEQSIRENTTPEAKNRLYRNALKIGQNLKNEFDVNTLENAMGLSRIVYKILGIDFRGDSRGEILIRKCYFSAYYSADVCRIISSLDAGLLAGLSSGGQLEFQERITEGSENCRAVLLPQGAK
jgi:hypothetical protein